MVKINIEPTFLALSLKGLNRFVWNFAWRWTVVLHIHFNRINFRSIALVEEHTFDVWRRLSSLHITFYAWPLFIGLFFGNPVSSFLDIHWIVTLSIIIRIFLSLLLVMFSLQQLQNQNSDISHLLEVKKALLAAIDRKDVEDSVISDNEEPTQSIFHKGDLGNFLPEYNKQVSPI